MTEPTDEEKRLFTVRNRDLYRYAAELGFFDELGGEEEPFIVEINKLPPNSLVVDIGVGQARFIEDFVTLQKEGRINNSYKIVGVDWYPKQNAEGILFKGNMEKMPISSESVELALSLYALGYYAKDQVNIDRQFEELSRILSKTGKAMLVLEPPRRKNPLTTDLFEAEDPMGGLVFEKRAQNGRVFSYDLKSTAETKGLQIIERRLSKGPAESGRVAGIVLKKK